MEPPSYPWNKGYQDPFINFVIEVEVCCTKTGEQWSNSKLQSEEDSQLVMDLSTGGLEQTSHALLLEGLKKEVALQILYKLSNDPNYKKRLMNEDETVSSEICESVSKFTVRTCEKFLGNIAQNALKTIRLGLLENG